MIFLFSLLLLRPSKFAVVVFVAIAAATHSGKS